MRNLSSFRVSHIIEAVTPDILSQVDFDQRSFKEGIRSLVIRWVRIWMEEEVVVCNLGMNRIMIATDEQMEECDIYLAVKLDAGYARRVFMNYTDRHGNRLILFRGKNRLPLPMPGFDNIIHD
ncbi:MAG: hypothetical protein Harvfovirus32_13 [Harvfovirus sp.]|uniref:Uncharacterized protein n=1 Tax=Harvfovirus sp. TaxID=2487768 RepID=A0A3G5A2F6_9VIRU|nr:MAG: hypothetical protein Harvfovirus32_13 [Harvfovirus sp.]